MQKVLFLLLLFFFNSEAKYAYLVLASVRALLDCNGDYNNDGDEDLAESIFGWKNMSSFLNFIFHVDIDKISGLFC